MSLQQICSQPMQILHLIWSIRSSVSFSMPKSYPLRISLPLLHHHLIQCHMRCFHCLRNFFIQIDKIMHVFLTISKIRNRGNTKEKKEKRPRKPKKHRQKHTKRPGKGNLRLHLDKVNQWNATMKYFLVTSLHIIWLKSPKKCI